MILGTLLLGIGASSGDGRPAAPEPTGDAPIFDWSISNGWLTAREGWSFLLRPGNGFSADVLLDDAWFLEGHSPSLEVTTLPSGGWEIRYTLPTGRLADRIEPFSPLGPDAWVRTITYTNRSGRSQDLTSARMQVQASPASGSGIWTPGPFCMVEVGGGRSVAIAYDAHDEGYSLSCTEAGLARAEVAAAWRLQDGQSAVIGRQGIWASDGAADTFREQARAWYAAAGIGRSPLTPDWLADAILYEASAGGHVESRFSNVGGFAHFSHQLDYLADLGFNAVWINSVTRHKSPPNPVAGGWNHYDPLDFEEIDSINGGSAAFGALAARMHAIGMHVFSEIVPWGGHSTQATALPQWWVRDRAGTIVQPWGAPAMDYSSPEWQAIVRNAMADQAALAGIEGIRVDVAFGQGPNWGSPATHHASYSTLGGSLELQSALREGATIDGQPPVLIPEDVVDRPEYYRVGPAVNYGAVTTALFQSIAEGDPTDAAGIRNRLRDFFENERGSLPSGCLVLRTLGNHDTAVRQGRLAQRFGMGPARALYGVCLVVPGVPMLYQEEEIGLAEDLRSMNWARRRVPEMGRGEPDYLSVQYVPEVFAVLRNDGGSFALGLVNLSGTTVSGDVVLPDSVDPSPEARAWDAVSGRNVAVADHTFSWTMDAYETAILRLGTPPVGTIPPRRFAGEDPPVPVDPSGFRVEAGPGGVEIRMGGLAAELGAGLGEWTLQSRIGATSTWKSCSGTMTVEDRGTEVVVSFSMKPHTWTDPPHLFVANADRWYVSARTALLRDRLLRRHFPFPAGSGYAWDRTMVWGNAPQGALYDRVLPAGRLWQSILEPLHPDLPALAWEDADGNALIADRIESNASNVVLTDRTDESTVDPYGLEVRFLSVDMDLAPTVRATAPGQLWDLSRIEPGTLNPPELRLRLRGIVGGVEDELRADRLPPETPAVEETWSDPGFTVHGDSVFLPSPGNVTWTNLAPVPGVYRIEFELRQSEISGEDHELEPHYRVEVDGVPQPLTWVASNVRSHDNAYFGRAQTPPVGLSGSVHSIRVTTTHTWCAVRRLFIPAPVGEGKRISMRDGFPAGGPQTEWEDLPWSPAPHADAPEGDGSAAETGAGIQQTALSEIFRPAAADHPVTLRAHVKVNPPSGAWSTTRLGYRAADGNAYWIDVPRHDREILRLQAVIDSVDEQVGPDFPIADLAIDPGDWIRITLVVDADSLRIGAEKWSGTEWSEPLWSDPYADGRVDRRLTWQLLMEGIASDPDVHVMDVLEVLDRSTFLAPLQDLVLFSKSDAWWRADAAEGMTGFPDGRRDFEAMFGAMEHLPRFGDVDGDGIADRVVCFDGGGFTQWVLDISDGSGIQHGWTSGSLGDGTGDESRSFGASPSDTVVPLLGDMDGDGRSDRVIFQAGTWWLDLSGGGGFGDGTPDWSGGAPRFGDSGDRYPAVGDFNGDGAGDRVLYRADGERGVFLIDYSRPGIGWGDGVVDRTLFFGSAPPGNLPVQSLTDLNGDHRAEGIVYSSNAQGTELDVAYSPSYAEFDCISYSQPDCVVMFGELGGDGSAPGSGGIGPRADVVSTY